MRIIPKVVDFILVVTLLSTPTYAQSKEQRSTLQLHTIGSSLGQGKPHKLKGARIFHRYQLYKNEHINTNLEFSYASWKTTDQLNQHIRIMAYAPVLRVGLYPHLNLEMSVGPAIRDTLYLGSHKLNSKFTFQDLLGISYNINRFFLNFSYLHYSNANLSKPNPGTEIKTLVSLMYQM